ncbi:hypothetical protein CVT25_006988 [Psilocybe cyanescens]|uniref:Uncharacterized protein n=1 Tax=Psilocybe cyanescens TaxID=93625 RepID=A0A409WYC6_PSICY|nr:hypothetical protein CVT25_006988 [Psilocybe cyanescens]
MISLIESTAAWQESKQQFLRHPSLRRSIKRQAEPKPDKGKKRDRFSRFVPPTFMIQDWTYMHAKDAKPPRRPPRPPSGPVPAVIVTPCTPTMSIHPDSSETPTPAPRVSPLIYSTSADGSTIKAATRDRPVKKQKIIEHDIAELKVELDDDNLFSAPSTSAVRDIPRRSFNIPESLKGIGFGSLQYSSSVLSAVSDMLCEEPSWATDASATGHLVARAASYITSTPAKRRLETLVEEIGLADSPQSDLSSSTRGPHPTDAESDLLPYPDVFDIDMYYGMECNRLSIPRRVPNPSSQNRRSWKGKNRASHAVVAANTVHDSPRSIKRFGYIPDAHSPKKAMSPIHEVKRYRDHYRHPAYTCPPSQAPNTSVDSLGNVKQSPQSPRTSPTAARVLTPLPLGDLTNRASLSLKTPTSSATATRSRKPSATVSFVRNDPQPSPIKERSNMHPPPPIVVISHHRFSSFSLAEESPITGSEGSQELRARLHEACDNFSKSVWTDESYSLEAVSLN